MKLPDPINSVAALIDAETEKHREEPRPHLGASLLGHPCDRYLWLSFRWAVIEPFPGRILRLFRRGQLEEANIIALLRSIGVDVQERAEQVRVDFGGHVSGSLDGIIEGGVPEAPKKRHVLECKTHSLKSFNDLQEKGVKESKPQHWGQMQVYMSGSRIDRALYFAICKDDDRIYTERVRYDQEAANKLIDRGHRITASERLPEPLSCNSSWYQCKYCPCHDFCFNSHMTKELNCRTCALSTPTKNSQWLCARYDNAEIPIDAQREGCSCHVLHPDLVPWKLLCSEDEFTAVYEIDGQKVRNGEATEFVIGSRELIDATWRTEDVSFPFGGR
jgi:hypothetical protein